MNLKHVLLLILSVSAASAADAETDYSRGVFIVNEDWYGHQNSTVNYLLPDDPDGDYWHYRVVQSENPGRELGCTNQFGQIWNGRFYFIAKQDKDPGADIVGGRLTVCDASTMKILHQSRLINPDGSQCDGRSFQGVDSRKGYISTSHGVWILNLATFEITGPVRGTENPNGESAGGLTNSAGALYHGQCGSMTLAAGRVFVAHQSKGLLVIDPREDVVTDTVRPDVVAPGAAIGSVVTARDGSVWASVAGSDDGMGSTLPYLLRVDPVSLENEAVPLEASMYAPSNSWYAWTPDSFCASAVTNTLYWGGSANTWFACTQIFSFDIDSRTQTKIIDLAADGENWKLYGCSLRPHPLTGELYMSLYHSFETPAYITRRCSATGVKIRDYEMISNYWFPSLPVFPQADSAEVGEIQVADGGDSATFHDLLGRRVASPRPGGIYIRNGRKYVNR